LLREINNPYLSRLSLSVRQLFSYFESKREREREKEREIGSKKSYVTCAA